MNLRFLTTETNSKALYIHISLFFNCYYCYSKDNIRRTGKLPRGISYTKVPKSVRACASYCGKQADICIYLKKNLNCFVNKHNKKYSMISVKLSLQFSFIVKSYM